MSNSDVGESLEKQLRRLKTGAGYYNAGIPNFEHLFGRDACVSALQMLHREPGVAKSTLLVLAKYQGRSIRRWREEYPGKILHEDFPGGIRQMVKDLVIQGDRPRSLLAYTFWRFPYYGSVDAGAWYLILLHHYWQATADAELVQRLWPTVTGVLGWLSGYAAIGDGDLVGFESHYIFGLRNQSWRDTMDTTIKPPVAMIEVQGYYYYALRCVAELGRTVMADSSWADGHDRWADRLKEQFGRSFVPEDNTYPLAVDGHGYVVRNATSNPGQLLFTGILDKTAAGRVVKRLFEDDLMTEYGLRTESRSEPSFAVGSYQNGSVWPFDNWVFYQGLAKTGHKREALHIKQGMVGVFEQLEYLPELYGVTSDGQVETIEAACQIQAWSAGALINMLDNAPYL